MQNKLSEQARSVFKKHETQAFFSRFKREWNKTGGRRGEEEVIVIIWCTKNWIFWQLKQFAKKELSQRKKELSQVRVDPRSWTRIIWEQPGQVKVNPRNQAGFIWKKDHVKWGLTQGARLCCAGFISLRTRAATELYLRCTNTIKFAYYSKSNKGNFYISPTSLSLYLALSFFVSVRVHK